jgi:Flp pilus assembly protein TadD
MVKNEEVLLPGCLDSVAGVADEIVVVDTGSTDATVDIARARGATVAFWPWVRLDFSTPQNVAIDHATGEWILALDADNRLDGSSHAEVRRLIDTHELVGYLVRHLSYHGDEGTAAATEHLTLRLFPRHPSIRWVGRIHPQVLPADPDLPFRVTPSNLVIHHEGYRPAHYASRENLAGYQSALEELVRQRPDDPYYHFGLGALQLRLGNAAQAERLLQRAITLNHARIREGNHAPYVVYAHVLLVHALAGQGRLPDAVDASHRLIELAPDLSDAWCGLGSIEARRANWRAAIAAYQRALACQEGPAFVPTDRATAGWKALVGLGHVYLELGQFAAARAPLERAAAENPSHPAIRAGLARLGPRLD